ncbi:unnamed protein product [Mytilus coruscus]|uniref:Uncharacterized protein n=1 Tax=Mytilus coruscus TaxID=42192 RepID=A0A6J8A0G6_MYTCO|nr:unnamed protein product [Mytilus coruscus]
MNYCNFAKVIIARSTKDKTAIDCYNQSKQQIPEPDKILKPQYNNHLSIQQRYENYSIFMGKYPKMLISSYNYFRLKLPKLQDYIYQNKYYVNKNKTGEKEKFVSQFSLVNWMQMKEIEKHQHTLEECPICTTKYNVFSSLHTCSKVENKAENLKSTCTNLVDTIQEEFSATPSINKVTKAVVQVINPVFASKFDVNFETAIAESFHLSPTETPESRKNTMEQTLNMSMQSINSALTDNDNDVRQFLTLGKSYKSHDRERMIFFSTKEESRKITQKKIEQENLGKLKPKIHHGNFDKYKFDRENFIEELSTIEEGQTINWTSMARKHNFKNLNNKMPLNSGQILMAYAKEQGIDVYKFNKQSRVSGRDYLRRVRRAKKRLLKTNISINTPRSAKILRGIVKEKKYYEKRNHRLHAAGVLRVNTDEYYDKLTQPELDKCLINLQENHHCNSNTETKRNILKAIQRSRYIKVWHDHSDILSHTYINFMISYMYDSANFLTSKEYLERNPTIKDTDIQKIVERPQLYILGQSASTDQDQRTYIQTRMEDIVELSEGTKFQDVTFTDKIRIFSGDNPQDSLKQDNREVEHTAVFVDLEDRRKLVTEGYLWKKIEGGNFNPFKNLKKEEIINELDHRKIEIMKEDKPSLQQELTELLHGICRPPALMLNDP